MKYNLARTRRFVSVKNKMMFFFLLAILIPVVIMFINSYISSQQMLERKYTDLLADITRQSNIRIEEFLEDTKQISLISSYGINSYISAVSQENYPVQNYLHDSSVPNELQATQLLMNYITMKDRAISIYVYNLNQGSDLYIAPNKPIDYTYHPRNEEWFNDFLRSDDITRDLPTRLDMQTKGDDNWAIYNLRKIFDMENGKLLGLMVVSVDIDFISRLNKRMQAGNRSAFTVVDNSDSIIFNNNYDLIGKPFKSLFPLREDALAADLNRQIVRVSGKDYILIQSPFEVHDWKTYMYMPVEELAVESDILKRNLWTIVVVLLLFALISSMYMSNLITRPIKQLIRNMTLVEQGKFDNLPVVRSNDEIGVMASRFEQMSAELKQLVERIYVEQEQKVEAEIRALQAQISPHFLYNTLNSVKWIATMQQSDTIVEMTEALISMLRYTAKTDNRLVPIREELEHIDHYIVIQKVRYFNRIEFHSEIEPALAEQEIPKLSIQPLVENAIFHGIADQEDGLVSIEVRYAGNSELAITVKDNGAGMSRAAADQLQSRLDGEEVSGGIGIINVHQRIRRGYGGPYGVSFQSSPGQGAVFVIRIPIRSRKEAG
ncbi:sensor histidine kinase [Paenibacillus sp. FSL R7-0312]|uniref:sensor histidine kinase n=1 Tax=unclassified Paenibacillus TaxID=185978 RepID=UPI000AA5D7B4|nr:sensor histidine kinase [Paenibacillus sp. FSL R5-0912]